jgi:glc operon protein GlcG
VPDVRSVTTVTYAAAARILAAAVLTAAERGLAVCVAVTDVAGDLVAFGRMDGAPLLSAGIARDKAYTVAAFNGVPTDQWYDLIKDEPALHHGIVHTPRLVVFAGGVPLLAGDVLVGAIGVSGGTAEQDAEIARAAAASL